MRSHMQTNATIVPKGIAEEDREAIRRKFKQSTDVNATPGTSAAVYTNEQAKGGSLPSKR